MRNMAVSFAKPTSRRSETGLRNQREGAPLRLLCRICCAASATGPKWRKTTTSEVAPMRLPAAGANAMTVGSRVRHPAGACRDQRGREGLFVSAAIVSGPAAANAMWTAAARRRCATTSDRPAAATATDSLVNLAVIRPNSAWPALGEATNRSMPTSPDKQADAALRQNAFSRAAPTFRCGAPRAHEMTGLSRRAALLARRRRSISASYSQPSGRPASAGAHWSAQCRSITSPSTTNTT